jgi:hypothetical protein
MMDIQQFNPDNIRERTTEELLSLDRTAITHLATLYPDAQPFLIIKRKGKHQPETRASYRSLLSLYRLGMEYDVVGVAKLILSPLRNVLQQPRPIEKLMPEREIFPDLLDDIVPEEEATPDAPEEPVKRKRGRPKKEVNE